MRGTLSADDVDHKQQEYRPTFGNFSGEFTPVKSTPGYDTHRIEQQDYPTQGRDAPRQTSVQTPCSAVDASLLRRALEIVQSLDPGDVFSAELHLSALCGLVMELWESAQHSSEYHQQTLAALENGVRSASADGHVTPEQVAAFREALRDINRPSVGRQSVDIIRTLFVEVGFAPLAFVEFDDDLEHDI